MTKKYSTKRSLVASALALLLCLTMLAGTTFAWFTDSVTSANNIIKTGKLDVEMYWADGTLAVPTDDEGWTDASTGAIFDYDNWEPGYVQARHIKIANEGSLALKYKVNVVANGEVSDLSDVIDVYYIDPAVQIADRTELTAVRKLGTLTEVLANLGTSGNGTLLAGDNDTITIAFKMQESAGNEYQNKSIGTDFSIQILASQLASEEDSFDNQYDAEATYPKVSTVVFKAPTTRDEVLPVGNANIVLPAGSEAGTYQAVISNLEEYVDQEGNTVVAFELDLTKDGVKVENDGVTEYQVSYFIGLNKNLGRVLHKGAPIEGATYDAATGYVHFTVSDFSPFQIDSYTSLIRTADELADNLAKGGTFVLANDVDLAGIEWIPAGTADVPFAGTFDGNGYTVSNLTVKNSDYASFIAYADASAVIRNVDFANVNIVSTKHAAGVVCQAPSGVTLENVTVSGNITAPSYAGGLVHNVANAVIKNCASFANVSASRAGGIASWVTVNATLENVVNYGAVTGTTGASGIAHGFAGTVKNAVNYGPVTAEGYEPAAGIAGVQKGASTYAYCANYGKIVSKLDDANASAAGILGQTPGSAATLVYCANYGSIVAEQSYAAGIAYSLYGQINASYCYNNGSVNGADGAGAIAPKAQYGTADKASYCLNAGAINSANGVVYLGSKNNVSCYDLSTGTLVEVGKTDAVAFETALAVLNGGADAEFFASANGTIAPAGASVTLVSNSDELEAALKAGKDIVFANDIVVTKDWDNRYTGAKTTAPIAIDGAGRSITFLGTVSDAGNYHAAFRFQAAATVKNLTFDMSGVAGTGTWLRAISAASDLVVDRCTFIGSDNYTKDNAVVIGDINTSAQINVTASITNSTFINWRRGISDNENAKELKSVVISGNSFDKANVYVSAYESVTFTGNVMEDSLISITSYTNAANVKVVATGNVLDADYAVYNVIGSASKVFGAANVTAQDDFVVNAR